MTFSPSKLVAAAALVALTGSASAALTAFTTVATFNSATILRATDTFEDVVIDLFESPITRTVGTYGYTATADQDFYGAGSAADKWLSTNFSGTDIVFGTFTGGPRAIGGFFFGSNVAGAFQAGETITVTATDSLGASLSSVITNATTTSFRGFVSTGNISTLTVSIGNIAAWNTVNDLVLAIPEPGTYAMLLLGLATVGAVARRRRNA